MRIGILGTGRVGSTLGQAWAKSGHEVKFGSRRPDSGKVVALVESIDAAASAGSVADAGAFGDVVVLATPWDVTRKIIEQAGDLRGKVILDCTNPLSGGLALGYSDSGGESVARWAEGALVVKIFNTTGSDNMTRPQYGETTLTMLYAGDDAAANSVAADLARDVGFEPIELGPLSAARLLEPLAMAWITLAYDRGMGTDCALQVLRRPRG